MPVVYIADQEFKMSIKERKAELRNVEGHMRWVVVNNEGMEYIMRPESAREQEYGDKKD